MRAAPSVQAPSCQAGPWRALQQALFASSITVVALWTGAHAFGDLSAWLLLTAFGLGLMAALLAGRWLPSTPSQFMWNGAAWSLQSPRGERRTGHAVLMLDLGAGLLVRFAPDAGAQQHQAAWLPMRRADAPQAWRALRVALLASRPQVSASRLPRQAA